MTRDELITTIRAAGLTVGTNISGVTLVGSPLTLGIAHITLEEMERLADTLVAAELRSLHAEVLEQCRLNGMGSEREAKLMAENEANERNLCQLTDELAKTVALLRQAQEALETDDWQKKMQASIDIKKHLGVAT